MQRTQFLAIFVAALIVSGCGNKESQLVGKWSGSLALSSDQQKDPMAAKIIGKMGKMPLELKQDHTFTATLIFPLEGTWNLSSDTVTLQPTKIMGQSIDDLKSKASGQKGSDQVGKPFTLKLSSDAKSLTVQDDKGTAKSQMVFTKEP